MRVLVIEDNLEVARQIEDTLERALYVVDVVHDGGEGLYLGATETYDAVILDLGLPKMDGMEVLQKWRSEGLQMPVLILTARQTWREKVAGLRAGADDYLSKPFELEEMLARVEALIRRASGHASSIYTCGAITLDTDRARATVNGHLVDLTGLEFRLLAYLIMHQGKVVSKTELTEHLYHQDFVRDSNVIEVLVNRLRKKLGNDSIKTLRGLGYQMDSSINHA